MNRQNWPQSEQFPQANFDCLRELAYAVGAVLGAGFFGVLCAYIVWGFK